jgi:uncharacterized membrane protein (DUF2068 family)
MRRGAGGGETLVRVIAVERLVRGLLLIGAGVYLAGHTGTDIGSLANRIARGIELDPRRPWVRHLIAKLGRLRRHEVLVFGIGALGYGALELVEGAGLWLRKRWAEWLTVIATALLVPFELYELVHRPSLLKGAGLAVNVVVVAYLYRVVRAKAAHRDG